MRNLLKRSTTFFAGQMLGKLFTTLVFVWMARVFGPAQFGIGTLIYILLNINSFLFDIGLGQWYQKHVTDARRGELFTTVIFIKLAVGSLGGLLCIAYLFFVSHSFILILLFVIASLLDIVTGPSSVYYLELKKPIPPSLSQLFRAAGIAIFLLVFRNNTTVIHSIYGYILGSIAWLVIWLPREEGALGIPSFEKSFRILKESSQYAYLQITSFAYARADSLVIQQTLGAASLGIYGTAYRYLEAAAMFPNAIAQNLFHISAKEHIPQKQLVKLAIFTSLLGLITAGATYFLSPFLITGLMGPAYAAGIPILRILSIVVFLFFFNAPLATFIQSSSLLKQFLPFGIGNTVLNIVLNLFLIPLYGIQAAAWNMVVTEVLGGLINVYFVERIYSQHTD